MSDPFYSNDLEVISRKLTEQKTYTVPINITDHHIQKCIEWINTCNATKVGLQFNDFYIKLVPSVLKRLIRLAPDKEYYFLVDSQCASCCVDEISAEHGQIDVIIKFGPSCLSVTNRYPVLYIFGEANIDISACTAAFKEHFPDKTSDVAICYDVYYQHAIEPFVENLKEYENIIVTSLALPHQKIEVEDGNDEITICKRVFIFPKGKLLDEYSIFFIGWGSSTLSHIMCCLDECPLYVYDPVTNSVKTPEQMKKQIFLKRNFYIEKAKDAKRIGILVNTLGVSGYLSAISRYRHMIQAAGKKSYTFAVGKTNVAKLANFADIDVFVNISCPETTMMDSKEFLQPIITPQELEIALHEREWSETIITDITELQTETISYDKPQLESDVSLITGKMRALPTSQNTSTHSDDTVEESQGTVVQKTELVIAEIHENGAGEVLSNRYWKGLEQRLGETPPSEIQQGKKGIACEYEEEREQLGS